VIAIVTAWFDVLQLNLGTYADTNIEVGCFQAEIRQNITATALLFDRLRVTLIY
jgi:hypothetical protein